MSGYIIGIDLGTTNTALAYGDCGEAADAAIRCLPVLQLVKAGVVEERSVLPSFLYLPGEHELAQDSLRLPWTGEISYCAGEFARRQGSLVPSRLVSSAKSWLCHRGVDRKADLLPFQAPPEVPKISPVEASRRYLSHLRDCWNCQISQGHALEKQLLYLAVPASFDAVARELTVLAAREAGMEVTLVEEPQAAFYAWLYDNEREWRNVLEVGDLVLVVDVGGGTTDLSLVSVIDDGGRLALHRDAVGDHILLGGDNMDLALAHLVSGKLPAARLDAWQSVALWHSCREAKEAMLSGKNDRVPISILGRGSSVIGGSLKAEMTREEVEHVLLDGFFPKVRWDDPGVGRKKVGLTQIGLPYALEPAVTRHIASFLRDHRQDYPIAAPTAILFNGGVFNAAPLRQRVVEVLDDWLKELGRPPLAILESGDFDMAVARGAVYYGKARLGQGVRIRGGAAQSYYLGIAGSRPAVPGMPPPLKALCVVPHGMEEGSEADIPGIELGLTVGEPVEFPFFNSSKRKKDEIGSLLPAIEEDLERNVALETTFTATGKAKPGETIPVRLHSKVTEIGTVEISCSTPDGQDRWALEFNIRQPQ